MARSVDAATSFGTGGSLASLAVAVAVPLAPSVPSHARGSTAARGPPPTSTSDDEDEASPDEEEDSAGPPLKLAKRNVSLVCLCVSVCVVLCCVCVVCFVCVCVRACVCIVFDCIFLSVEECNVLFCFFPPLHTVAMATVATAQPMTAAHALPVARAVHSGSAYPLRYTNRPALGDFPPLFPLRSLLSFSFRFFFSQNLCARFSFSLSFLIDMRRKLERLQSSMR